MCISIGNCFSSSENFYPPLETQVIEKIECFWDDSTVEYQHPRSTEDWATHSSSALDDSNSTFKDNGHFDLQYNKRNTNTQKSEKMEHNRLNINVKIKLLNEMNNNKNP